MKFSRKSLNKNEDDQVDLSCDLETLMRHRKRGIPLTQAQEQIIRDADAWEHSAPDRKTPYLAGRAETQHPKRAREILSSPAGQLALQLGVARDLLTEYEWSGRMEFDEAYVRRMHKAHVSNCETVAAMSPDDNLRKMYESIMERERRLFSEFASIENSA